MTILWLAELNKTMNRPGSNQPGPTVTLLTAYVSENMEDRGMKFWHNLYSGLQFVLLKFGIDIFEKYEKQFSDFEFLGCGWFSTQIT